MLDQAFFLQWLLAFGRATAFLFVVPLLGGTRVPFVVKAGTALALAATSVVRRPGSVPGLDGFIVLLVKEVAVGLVLGWGLVLAFAAIQAAGFLVEVQYGFGIGTVVDPIHATESTALAQLYTTLAMILFIAVDGHHVLLRLLARSFEVVPPTALIPATGVAGGAIELFRIAFVWGVQLAAPLLIASLLVEAGLGLVARAVPQINVFIVSLPLKVGLGILLIGLLLQPQLAWMADLFDVAARESLELIVRVRP